MDTNMGFDTYTAIINGEAITVSEDEAAERGYIQCAGFDCDNFIDPEDDTLGFAFEGPLCPECPARSDVWYD
jgi:hypothetical protein